jgi:hypothetical protein
MTDVVWIKNGYLLGEIHQYSKSYKILIYTSWFLRQMTSYVHPQALVSLGSLILYIIDYIYSIRPPSDISACVSTYTKIKCHRINFFQHWIERHIQNAFTYVSCVSLEALNIDEINYPIFKSLIFKNHCFMYTTVSNSF